MGERTLTRGFTLDEQRARELDDAFFVERTSSGFKLTVSIADVASLVMPGSHEDRLAAARSLSVYDPLEGKTAMFSRGVAQGMASLLPGRIRPVVCIAINYDASGRIISEKAFRANLRSEGKVFYERFDPSWSGRPDGFDEQVATCINLASLIWKRRVSDEGIPSWQSGFDAEGGVAPGLPSGTLGSTVTHEFMVAVNRASTRIVGAATLPMIYRNQSSHIGGPKGRYEVVGTSSIPYGQFSCPIRRYPDLVNQRQLCSVIESGPAPHDIGFMASVCVSVNRAAQRADQAVRKKQEEPNDPLSRRIRTLSYADAYRFGNCLEFTPADAPMADELHARTVQGRLRHSDIAFLLFGHGRISTDAIKDDLLSRAAGAPEEMARIWEHAAMSRKTGDFTTYTARRGGSWVSDASVSRFAARAKDADPVRARGLALVSLAAAFLGRPTPVIPGQPLVLVDTHAKSKLETLARLMEWDEPQFTVEHPIVNGKMRHRCSVGVETGTLDYRSPDVGGSSGQAVENIAATLALRDLEPVADDILRRQVKAYGVDIGILSNEDAMSKPLTALAHFCRKHGASHRVVWLEERPVDKVYSCSVELSASGNTLSAQAKAASRIVAMNAAASQLISAILKNGAKARRAPEMVSR